MPASIFVNNFMGAVKLIDPRLLEDNMATEAINCELETGAIESTKAPSLVRALNSNTGSIYVYNGTPYEFAGDCDIVESPVQNSTGRMYFTDGIMPKKTTTSLLPATRRLGIQRPTTPVTASGDHLSGTTVVATVSYYYTFVTSWGEESAPGPESAVFEIYDTLNLSLANLEVPAFADQEITKKRIYRLAVGTSGAQYQFLAEIDASETTYTDTTLTANLGETCATETWIGPQNDLMGLLYMGNGYMAGFRGNEVYITEPYYPYAWPLSSMFSVGDQVVGLGHYGQTLVVCTNGKPVMLNGVDPRGMSQDNYPESYPCLSKKSIVSMLDCVIYASKRGLVMCSSQGVNLLTGAIWSEEDWEAIGPQNIIGFGHKGRYYGFVRGTTNGFVIDYRSFLGGSKYPTVIDIDLDITGSIIGGCVDKNDALYLIVDNGAGGRSLYKYAGGVNKLTATWTSKTFFSPIACNLGACHINMTGTGELVYKDGIDTTYAVDGSSILRLPEGAKVNERAFTYRGTGDVYSIHLGETIKGIIDG